MNNKEIAFVINGFPHTSETFIVNQIVAAIKGGHTISILAEHLQDIESSSQSELLKLYHLMESTSVFSKPAGGLCQNISLFFKILQNLPPKQRRILLKAFNVFTYRRDALTLDAFYHGARFIGHENNLIYHAQYGPNGRAAAIAKQLGIIRGKIITSFHGYDAHCDETNQKSLEKFYRPLFKWGDVFTANTHYLVDLLRRMGCPPEKISLLPMGVDTTLFSPTQKKNRPLTNRPIQLLSVGRLIYLKGHHLGLEIIKKIVTNKLTVNYTIIGDGPEKENLLKQIDRLGLHDYVKLVGKKNQKEVRDYMRNCDIFLMTSTGDNTGRRETQGMVNAEAQACGIPVVAFNSGGVGYTIDQGVSGILVEEENTNHFAQAVIDLINNPIQRETMGLAAVNFIQKNYSLDTTSRILNSIYDKVLI